MTSEAALEGAPWSSGGPKRPLEHPIVLLWTRRMNLSSYAGFSFWANAVTDLRRTGMAGRSFIAISLQQLRVGLSRQATVTIGGLVRHVTDFTNV